MRLGGAAVIEDAAAGEGDEIAGAARLRDFGAEALIGVAGRASLRLADRRLDGIGVEAFRDRLRRFGRKLQRLAVGR